MKVIRGFLIVFMDITDIIRELGKWAIDEFPKSIGILMLLLGTLSLIGFMVMYAIVHPIFIPFTLIVIGLLILWVFE